MAAFVLSIRPLSEYLQRNTVSSLKGDYCFSALKTSVNGTDITLRKALHGCTRSILERRVRDHGLDLLTIISKYEKSPFIHPLEIESR